MTVVNNNHALGQCVEPIRDMYGERPGNPGDMCRFSQASFARIAEDMGGLGIRVEDPAEIAPALRNALAADVPSVVEVITDPECFAPEPWTPASL